MSRLPAVSFCPHPGQANRQEPLPRERFCPNRLNGVQTKRNAGQPTHSPPKSATFSKEYNSSQHVQLFGPSTCSGTLQRHNHPGRIQYAQGTLRPCNPQAKASYCLILVAESVEVPSRGQEQNSASPPLFCISSVFWGNKKGVELNAFTYLRPSTARNE